MVERAFAVQEPHSALGQLTLAGNPPASNDPRPRAAGHGEVFTRSWVVDLILDLVGYTEDRDVAGMLVVEPSCGDGAFLRQIVARLIRSSVLRGHDLTGLGDAVRAFDLLDDNVARARADVHGQLIGAGATPETAEALSCGWVTQGDFLLSDLGLEHADFVVGNPPYLRLESVPPGVMSAYRRAWPTMRGRSDIYVGFIERGLRLLKADGTLGYICADRWMRNQYGAELRELITTSYSVEVVLTMHDVDAFESPVSAYPATIVLRNRPQQPAAVVTAKAGFGEADAKRVRAWIRKSRPRPEVANAYEACRLDPWFAGRDLWPSGSPGQLSLIANLESRFPPLQDPRTGTRVGIGVATGCDDVYITTDDGLVEEDRLLPLLRAADTASGTSDWSGAFLVNPWNGHGLVDLTSYPRLRDYVARHSDRLRSRHVARRRPGQWYRTIDRVDATLVRRPKLLLPDLKARAHPVLDEGRFYPHHNLYFVVSDTWDPEVLGGLLLSDVANLFVGAYCVRMRGGCYRFQAQYLRRIRVPSPHSVVERDRRLLAKAFSGRDVEAATSLAMRVYGIDEMPDIDQSRESHTQLGQRQVTAAS